LTKQEILEIFNFADIDRDGVLSPSEWNNFYDIFVWEFQNCNKDGIWLLNAKDLGECVGKANWLKYFAPNGNIS